VAEIGLSQDYRDLLIALLDAGAEFLLIGGWALALHGHGRGTDDMECKYAYKTRPQHHVIAEADHWSVANSPNHGRAQRIPISWRPTRPSVLVRGVVRPIFGGGPSAKWPPRLIFH
jgi:hypothetical protein